VRVTPPQSSSTCRPMHTVDINTFARWFTMVKFWWMSIARLRHPTTSSMRFSMHLHSVSMPSTLMRWTSHSSIWPSSVSDSHRPRSWLLSSPCHRTRHQDQMASQPVSCKSVGTLFGHTSWQPLMLSGGWAQGISMISMKHCLPYSPRHQRLYLEGLQAYM
jgi:hypothetical protein